MTKSNKKEGMKEAIEIFPMMYMTMENLSAIAGSEFYGNYFSYKAVTYAVLYVDIWCSGG